MPSTEVIRKEGDKLLIEGKEWDGRGITLSNGVGVSRFAIYPNGDVSVETNQGYSKRLDRDGDYRFTSAFAFWVAPEEIEPDPIRRLLFKFSVEIDVLEFCSAGQLVFLDYRLGNRYGTDRWGRPEHKGDHRVIWLSDGDFVEYDEGSKAPHTEESEPDSITRYVATKWEVGLALATYAIRVEFGSSDYRGPQDWRVTKLLVWEGAYKELERLEQDLAKALGLELPAAVPA